MDSIIGEIVKYYRKNKKLSQQQLSEGICTREYIGKIERGEYIPSCDMLLLLSQRINVNLLGVFSKVYDKKNLVTFFKCQDLNFTIQKNDLDLLQEEIIKCRKSKEFEDGVPFRTLCYAEAVYLSLSKKINEALAKTLEGICSIYPSFPSFKGIPIYLTNVDFALMLSYSVYLGRKNDHSECRRILMELYERAKILLSEDTYEADFNHQFWINLVCNCTYNLFFWGDFEYSEMLNIIENALQIQKENTCSYMLPELMMCKAALLNALSSDSSQEYLIIARTLSHFYYDAEESAKIERIVFRRINKTVPINKE